MKPKYSHALHILFFLLHQPSNAIITFFLNPYPTDISKKSPYLSFMSAVQKPGKFSKKALYSQFLNHYNTGGIFSTYAGYVALSNHNGQITFPKKTSGQKFLLLITEKIVPVMMLGTTVHHWQLDALAPAQLFSVERKHDKESNSYFWDTQETTLPENDIIPLNTIVIFAKPKNIYVPIGITLTTAKPQLHLPTIFVRKTMNFSQSALWLLTIKNFFSPVNFMEKKESDTYYSKNLINS